MTKGLTILELVMVMMIVAFSAMIVMPQWTAVMNIWALEEETREVAVKIREVQQKSMMNNTRCGLQFTTNTNYYSVGSRDISGGFIPEATFYLNDGIITGTIAGSATFYFEPSGAPKRSDLTDFAFSNLIYFNDTRTGNRLIVEVVPITGRVRIRTS